MERLEVEMNSFGMPVLSYEAMDDYATRLLRNHAPEALGEDAFLDIQTFVRRDMGCRIACHALSRDASIQAAAFFGDTFPVFYDDGQEKRMHVLPNTIILDPSLLDRPYDARFKLAHEAGHLLLHRNCVKSGPMLTEEVNRSAKPMKNLAEMEQQANWFAECLMMNRASLLSFWRNLQPYLIKRFGDRRDTAGSYAVTAVAGAFRVNRYAAVRRLECLGLKV